MRVPARRPSTTPPTPPRSRSCATSCSRRSPRSPRAAARSPSTPRSPAVTDRHRRARRRVLVPQPAPDRCASSRSLRALLEAGRTRCIEVSAHPVLGFGAGGRRRRRRSPGAAAVLGTLRRERGRRRALRPLAGRGSRRTASRSTGGLSSRAAAPGGCLCPPIPSSAGATGWRRPARPTRGVGQAPAEHPLLGAIADPGRGRRAPDHRPPLARHPPLAADHAVARDGAAAGHRLHRAGPARRCRGRLRDGRGADPGGAADPARGGRGPDPGLGRRRPARTARERSRSTPAPRRARAASRVGAATRQGSCALIALPPPSRSAPGRPGAPSRSTVERALRAPCRERARVRAVLPGLDRGLERRKRIYVEAALHEAQAGEAALRPASGAARLDLPRRPRPGWRRSRRLPRRAKRAVALPFAWRGVASPAAGATALRARYLARRSSTPSTRTARVASRRSSLGRSSRSGCGEAGRADSIYRVGWEPVRPVSPGDRLAILGGAGVDGSRGRALRGLPRPLPRSMRRRRRPDVVLAAIVVPAGGEPGRGRQDECRPRPRSAAGLARQRATSSTRLVFLTRGAVAVGRRGVARPRLGAALGPHPLGPVRAPRSLCADRRRRLEGLPARHPGCAGRLRGGAAARDPRGAGAGAAAAAGRSRGGEPSAAIDPELHGPDHRWRQRGRRPARPSPGWPRHGARRLLLVSRAVRRPPESSWS